MTGLFGQFGIGANEKNTLKLQFDESSQNIIDDSISGGTYR
jgi:hypothetical protein